ncbi:MAG: FAD-dependent oxidoreductase [Planctomycetaceae bacterium]|nr:FAD-dependent oxidoreductase [Planctomycetaceae bacterium]
MSTLSQQPASQALRATHAICPRTNTRGSHVSRVGIVGGGPGGLMTAYFLEKLAGAPLRITLFEASPRLGGKLHTPHFSHAPAPYNSVRYEAGAAEFYDYSIHDDDPLKELIAEMGLSIAFMGGSGLILEDRLVANLEDLRDQFGEAACQAFLNFDGRARGEMSPTEFYHSDFPEGASPSPGEISFETFLRSLPNPRARQIVETLIHSDLATEPRFTSTAYGLQNYLMNDPAYMQLYSIVGGNDLLPRELASRIAAEKCLEHRVENITAEQDGRFLVTTSSQQGDSVEEFDYVVVALPHNQVSRLAFRDEQLAVAIQQHQAYYDYPAHYLRVTILFDSPFWRKTLTESFWMLDRFGGCCLYDESLREPALECGVLGWLLGGQAASDLAHHDDAHLIDLMLDSLPDFLREGRDRFLSGHVHRWIGAVNARPGGVRPLPQPSRHHPAPVKCPRLLLVGDYLYDSTLNGVCDSADYVARWIAGDLTNTI